MTRPDGALESWLWTPRHSPWRWPLAAAAALAGVAHIPVIGPHLAEAAYMGEEFIVLTAACLLLALAALVCDSAAVYGLSLLTGGLAIIGYVATRLVAFPQLADDVGHWFEPLGIVCVLAESVAVIAATSGLLWRRGVSTAVARVPESPPATAGYGGWPPPDPPGVVQPARLSNWTALVG